MNGVLEEETQRNEVARHKVLGIFFLSGLVLCTVLSSVFSVMLENTVQH